MASLYLAGKNVTRKKERSILTVIGVLLAVGAFISLLSIAEGMYRRIQHDLNGRSVDVYVMPRSALPMPLGPLANAGASTETVSEIAVKTVRADNNVETAEPVTRFEEVLDGRGVVIWGINPRSFAAFLPHLEMPTGRPPQANNEIIVGPSLARDMNLNEGGTLTLARKDYLIVGIFRRIGGLQDYFCYVTPEAAREMTGRDAQEVWVKLRQPEGRAVTAEDLNHLPVMKDYVARSREEYLGAANEIINYAWLMQFAIAAIGVLIAMTAAMNTMLMSTYERLKEFATLRAIGASRFTVVGMILTESLMLSLIGGLCGIVLGVMGSHMLDTAVVTLFRLTFPVAQITLPLVLEAVLLSAFVGLVGALIPCFLVFRMNIISGLRQE